MKYRVVLSLEAVEDALRITMLSRSKSRVIDASRRLHEALEQEPEVAGSHLSEGLNFIDREPLRAFFTIFGDEATVETVSVKQV